MATIEVNGTSCYYTLEGSGKDLVLLHGWGQNTQMMQFIQDHFSDRFRVLNLDFPGFGQSHQPPCAWGVEEYTCFLEELLRKLNIKNPIFVGHSFGCRVAIHYAARNQVRKMALTGAAGLRPKAKTQNTMKVAFYKTAKKILQTINATRLEEKLKKSFGSEDYKNASGVMRDTLVKVVQDDVSELLPLIDCPTFLFWGKEDDATPLWMGQELEKRIQNAGLAVLENEGHFAYFNQGVRFCRALDAFLEGE